MSTSDNPTGLPPVANRGGTAREVQSNLVSGGGSLQEFLAKNNKHNIPAPVPNGTAPLESTAQPAVTPAPIPAAPSLPTSQPPSFASGDPFVDSLVASAEAKLTPPAVEPPKPGETPPVEAPLEEVKTEGDKLLDRVRKGPQESIKDLRRKESEARETLLAREAELTAAREKLEKYEKGEEVPEPIKERLTNLEKIEKIHSLKTSPEYQRNFVEPEEQLCTEAVALAEKYQVDPTVLDEAVQLEDEKQLNQFLRKHFDDVGALEVKNVIKKIEDIRAKATEAEKEPVQTLQTLRQEYQRTQVTQETERVESIKTNSERGWVDALSELRESGQFPELMLIGDPEHDNRVKEVIKEVATEYGRFVTNLANEGIKKLNPDLAKINAKRYILSEITSINSLSRAQHHQRAEEVVSERRRTNSLVRPPVGMRTGGAPAAGGGDESKAPSIQTAARGLLDHAKSVVGRR